VTTARWPCRASANWSMGSVCELRTIVLPGARPLADRSGEELAGVGDDVVRRAALARFGRGGWSSAPRRPTNPEPTRLTRCKRAQSIADEDGRPRLGVAAGGQSPVATYRRCARGVAAKLVEHVMCSPTCRTGAGTLRAAPRGHLRETNPLRGGKAQIRSAIESSRRPEHADRSSNRSVEHPPDGNPGVVSNPQRADRPAGGHSISAGAASNRRHDTQ